MKKITTTIVCVLAALLSASVVHAENISMNDDAVFMDKSVVDTVMNVVEAHITEIDTGSDGGEYLSVDNNLKTYLSDKEDVVEITVPKNNYNLDITVKDYQDKDTVVYLQLGLKASWNYVEDIDSGYGKLIEVLVDKANGKIVDIYDRTNMFDIAVRGDTLDLSKASVGISPELVSTAKQTYLQSQADAAISVAEAIERDEEELAQRNSMNASRSTNASYTWIYHEDVVEWARDNYDQDEPTSGNPDVDYIDFYMPDINAYDCTNFVSHALLAGDARVYDTGGSGISSTGWYCRDMNNRSSSWTGVANLHSFVTSNTTYGPGGFSMTWSYSYTAWEPGDFIQFHNGSIWRHSAVITDTLTTANGVVPLVTGRTGDDWYNNNELATDVYGSNAKRILHLYNYYS